MVGYVSCMCGRGGWGWDEWAMRGVVVVQQLSVCCGKLWVGGFMSCGTDGMGGEGLERDGWCLGEMPGRDACRYSRLLLYCRVVE